MIGSIEFSLLEGERNLGGGRLRGKTQVG
jgi:hypothetical protein